MLSRDGIAVVVIAVNKRQDTWRTVRKWSRVALWIPVKRAS